MKRAARIVAAVIAVLFIVFLIFRTPDTDPAAMRAKYGAPPSRFVKLGAEGPRVHLRDEGPRDAPAIVLLHGSNADLHTWDAWVRDLARDHRVIRFDQIGHGLTGANPGGDYSPGAYVDTVVRVADALGLKRFVLAGNSMGGGIATRFAMAHPERLTGLVLIDAGGAPPTSTSRGGNIGFRLAATPGVAQAMAQITPRSLIESSLRQSVVNQAIVTPAAIDRYWELLRYPGNREATLARFALPRQTFSAAAVARIRTPTLILWGEGDAVIPVAAARWFARNLPDDRLVIYPRVGHLPMEEAPAPTLRDLRAWLAQLPAADRAVPATARVDAPTPLP